MADERKRIDPEKYKAFIEKARELNATRREIMALREQPLITYDSTKALFADIHAEIERRKLADAADKAKAAADE